MKIKIITCHDVYNAGASLQAYALMSYLQSKGCDVSIIDYKPTYLSHHYKLSYVANEKYQKIYYKPIYLLLKLPKRLLALKSRKKSDFDLFKKDYLSLTRRYYSFEELAKNPPEADLYLAGSDQIWNTLFKNGFDPAFYLQFAPLNKIRASYAASFATTPELNIYDLQIKSWLSQLNKISVREESALDILKTYSLAGIRVLDPVFLLNKEIWEKMCLNTKFYDFVFVNDFDGNKLIKDIALNIAKQYNLKIVSMERLGYEDYVMENKGPLGFLTAIYNAKYIISNSFHVTAFSLIFRKDFYVIERVEKLNSRMKDLLELVNLSSRLVKSTIEAQNVKNIDWELVEKYIDNLRKISYEYLNELIRRAVDNGY